MLLSALIDWSRWQFAMTAMYHWLFVPFTLGVGIIMAIAESKYYRTGEDFWEKTAKFWQKIFAINFAAGIATGIILEFEFGTNWSNYSYFVGDIFGAPLAIEGILAFFMEATFFAVMFFGWGKVSKKFHLWSTWLTIIGATISAWWILVANAWMQYPAGMEFNPDTARNEMVDFLAVAFSPVAVVKWFHTVLSSWVLGSIMVMGFSAIYLLRKRHTRFAVESIKIGAGLGLFAILVAIFSGHLSAIQITKHQPMKLAAMENHWNGSDDAGLSVIGIPNKSAADLGNDAKEDWVFNLEIPGLLKLLSDPSDGYTYLPGINDIVRGGYTLPDGTIAPSAEERMANGKLAVQALADYRAATKAGDTAKAEEARTVLKDNFKDFGYAYLESPADLIPHITLLYFSFRIMVYLSGLFLLVFALALFFTSKKRVSSFASKRWFAWVMILCIPLVYICSQSGWILAEVGRQPWAIQDVLPLNAAISSLAVGSVKVTFFVFLILFSIMLVAEGSIMWNALKKGPDTKEEHK